MDRTKDMTSFLAIMAGYNTKPHYCSPNNRGFCRECGYAIVDGISISPFDIEYKGRLHVCKNDGKDQCSICHYSFLNGKPTSPFRKIDSS